MRKLIVQRLMRPVQQLCNREVCQHNSVSLAVMQEIARMQIAMPHVVLMHCLDRLCHGNAELLREWAVV